MERWEGKEKGMERKGIEGREKRRGREGERKGGTP